MLHCPWKETMNSGASSTVHEFSSSRSSKLLLLADL